MSLTPEDFAKAVKIIEQETIKPNVRIYSPGQFKTLREDAIDFAIDFTNGWDIAVMEEWAAYRRFERWLLSTGWRR